MLLPSGTSPPLNQTNLHGRQDRTRLLTSHFTPGQGSALSSPSLTSPHLTTTFQSTHNIFSLPRQTWKELTNSTITLSIFPPSPCPLPSSRLLPQHLRYDTHFLFSRLFRISHRIASLYSSLAWSFSTPGVLFRPGPTSSTLADRRRPRSGRRRRYPRRNLLAPPS